MIILAMIFDHMSSCIGQHSAAQISCIWAGKLSLWVMSLHHMSAEGLDCEPRWFLVFFRRALDAVILVLSHVSGIEDRFHVLGDRECLSQGMNVVLEACQPPTGLPHQVGATISVSQDDGQRILDIFHIVDEGLSLRLFGRGLIRRNTLSLPGHIILRLGLAFVRRLRGTVFNEELSWTSGVLIKPPRAVEIDELEFVPRDPLGGSLRWQARRVCLDVARGACGRMLRSQNIG